MPADPVRTVGVEEEFLLLRPGGSRSAPVADRVVRTASEADAGAQFERELKSAQAELASRPVADLGALSDDLHRLRRELATAAGRHDVRLVASGTNPVRPTARTTASERYEAMVERFGLVAREQLTCGMHIHVAVDSRDEAVRVIDSVASWLPLLLALSANSPYHRGEDSSYASFRTLLWGQWPTAGATGGFGDADTYDETVRQLIAIGAAGDKGMIYFAARASDTYPTVEFRVCDVCPDVADAVTIAALTRALADHVLASPAPDGIRPEVLRAATWRAARWGMSDDLVAFEDGRPALVPAWDLVDRIVDRLAPQLAATGDADLVRTGLDAIRARGTGAQRQRHAFARREDFDDVVRGCAVEPG